MEAERATIASMTVGPVMYVRPSGELDLAICDDLEQAIAAINEQGRLVYVDLIEATFIDASVLGAIVRAGHRLAARGCRLKIFGASGTVAEILTLTGIAQEYGASMEVPDVNAGTAPSPESA